MHISLNIATGGPAPVSDGVILPRLVSGPTVSGDGVEGTALAADASDTWTHDGAPASVRARLYSQSFMPAWFHERFALAEDARAAGYSTPETDRLFHLASHLNLEGTALEGWKLEIDTDARSVRR